MKHSKRRPSHRVAEFVVVLHDAAARAARDVLGVDDTAAASAADAIGRRVVEAFAGQILYIPTQYKRGLPDSYRSIWRDFDGRNHNALASRHGCSVAHVYDVVALMRALEIEHRQCGLFEDGDVA